MIRKTIECKLDKHHMHFTCPVCKKYFRYSVVHYDAFKLYGFDCNSCQTRFKVEFIKYNYSTW